MRRNNDLPNEHYVDPNPYTGEADAEGVDYGKLQRERLAKALAPYIPDEEKRRYAAKELSCKA